MRQQTILLMTVIVTLFIGSLATAEGPLRKRLSGGSEVPTAGGWKMPGGRIVEGTQHAVANARDRLTFWKKKERQESNAFVEGTGRFFRPDLARREQENAHKPFSFVRPASWFEPAEEPNPGPSSVSDWIGQDRPGFDN